ncbi:MAG: ATP12 family protein [Pseudomonadota bacterium]
MSDTTSPFDAIFDGHAEEPMRSAQRGMRPELPKRFWSDVALSESGGFYEIQLDGRPARTPGRKPLGSANLAVAEQLAIEWRNVGERLDPLTLPLTRLINVAIDRVEARRDEIVDDLVSYAGSDLLCYRADRPEGLVAIQAEHWDPHLTWIDKVYGVQLNLAQGVMPAEQSPGALDAYGSAVRTIAATAEVLAALSLATTLTGSAVLGLRLASGTITSDEAWAAAHVDEDWNRRQWGEDDEATRLREGRKRDFHCAAFVLAAHAPEAS